MDHDFDLKKGRILKALQIVSISAGRGWFETKETGRRKIEAGMAFVLLPGVWHRYRPNPKTGWRESWVEIQGPVLASLLKNNPEMTLKIIHGNKDALLLEEIIGKTHRLSRDVDAIRPELSAEAYRCLACLAKCNSSSEQTSNLRKAIFKAEHYLANHYDEKLEMQAVAKLVGTSYSNFRRAFLKQTGLSPWQYVLQVRLVQARRLLATNENKLDDIAHKVGFSSGFHLSGVFSKAFGISPSQWRKNITIN